MAAGGSPSHLRLKQYGPSRHLCNDALRPANRGRRPFPDGPRHHSRDPPTHSAVFHLRYTTTPISSKIADPWDASAGVVDFNVGALRAGSNSDILAGGVGHLSEQRPTPDIQLEQLQPTHLETYYSRALEQGRLDGKGGLWAQTVQHHHRVLSGVLTMR